MQKEKLLLIPGPTPVHPRIIHSLSLPTVSHVSPIMVKETKEALSNLKKVVFCERGQSFIAAGAGTLSMEMALLNTVTVEERVLVLSQGYFGRRMADIAACFGIKCDVIQSDGGVAVTPGELRSKLSESHYAAVAATHVDTATGACAPIEEYAEIIKGRQDILFIVDGVCATGGIEERMSAWNIDVILTAAQKCFGVPPGLAVLVLSDKAMAKRKQMESIPAYYADLMRWLPIMNDPSKYFSTPCVNEIRAFNEGIKIMLEEGMENRFQRHSKIAQAFRSALKALGFRLFTGEPYLADTLSVAYYPQGIKDIAFRTTLSDQGVIVAGGLGNLSGSVFRLGHMGNLSFSQVEFAVAAIESTLSILGYAYDREAGLQSARRFLK